MSELTEADHSGDLLSRFEARNIAVPMAGCWIWTASTWTNGYGAIRTATKYQALAHRVSYELYRGPIPAGLWVLHHCDVRCCVNPAHLYLGTIAENTADMRRRGRRYRAIGELSTSVKITEATAREIIGSYSSGERQCDIARRLGVAIHIVNNICWGGRWKHIHGDAIPPARARKALEGK